MEFKIENEKQLNDFKNNDNHELNKYMVESILTEGKLQLEY